MDEELRSYEHALQEASAWLDEAAYSLAHLQACGERVSEAATVLAVAKAATCRARLVAPAPALALAGD